MICALGSHLEMFCFSDDVCIRSKHSPLFGSMTVGTRKIITPYTGTLLVYGQFPKHTFIPALSSIANHGSVVSLNHGAMRGKVDGCIVCNVEPRVTWIIPVSKWLVTPIYKQFRPFGRGISPVRDLLTMVINHLQVLG